MAARASLCTEGAPTKYADELRGLSSNQRSMVRVSIVLGYSGVMRPFMSGRAIGRNSHIISNCLARRAAEGPSEGLVGITKEFFRDDADLWGQACESAMDCSGRDRRSRFGKGRHHWGNRRNQKNPTAQSYCFSLGSFPLYVAPQSRWF
jgi:hypothetical protein